MFNVGQIQKFGVGALGIPWLKEKGTQFKKKKVTWEYGEPVYY